MAGNTGTYDTTNAKEASLDRIVSIFNDLGVTKIYTKPLAPNDNSKNQPYFGGHLTDLAFLPMGDLLPSTTVSKKNSDPNRRIKYQSPLDLSWIDADGQVYDAPHAKLIYYPQYPEVRFSGFLKGSPVNASRWMDPYKEGRAEGRWLILGVNPESGRIYSYLVTPESSLSHELADTDYVEITQVFRELDLAHQFVGKSTRGALISKLQDIHNQGWIHGQKMNKNGITAPYKATNGGGYTLEALLGIPPNGIAEPDYLGWEVKQFGVKDFPTKSAGPTTLMTPEPDGGFYKDQGINDFIRKYGYPDRNGVPDRLNFGGIYKADNRTTITGLTLTLIGFDNAKARIVNASGAIALVDDTHNIAASWSFAKMMGHWKRKHAQAVYVPCLRQNSIGGGYEYHYGKDIELGVGTDFEMLLSSMSLGDAYYDPGIKLENASTPNAKSKRRSQFRVKHKNLDTLYRKFEFVDILTP